MMTFEKPSVSVEQSRYDELLHKEAMLESIIRLHSKLTDYTFRDAVGYLLKVKTDEQA